MNDGGPAFPGEQGHTPDRGWNQTWDPGMSIRDWFAGQALAGLAYEYEESVKTAARLAYAYADAMLAERSKP